MSANTLHQSSKPKERFASHDRFEINRGLLNGCSVYLSDRNQFPVRTGTFDREIHDKFIEFARESEVFIDVGAAEGFYSVYMLKNSKARVYACESLDDRGSGLLLNLEENTRDGHRLCYADIGGDCSVDRLAGHERGSVFLRIDLPESESDILSGAAKILDREDTKLIIKITSKEVEQKCMWILDEFGFDISIIGPAWWRAIVKDRSPEEPNRWIIAEKSELEGLFS